MKHYLNIEHIKQVAQLLTQMEKELSRIRRVQRARIESALHDQIEAILYDTLPSGLECQKLDQYLQPWQHTRDASAELPRWVSPELSNREMRNLHDYTVVCIRRAQLIKFELRKRLTIQHQQQFNESSRQEHVNFPPEEEWPKKPQKNPPVQLSPQYLNWEFLPAGNDYGIYSNDTPAVRTYLDAMRAKFPKEYDQQRIDRVLTLAPDAWYCGKLKHDGYSIFVFKDKNAAILECPIYGNALYLVWGDWKQLSQMTKEELRHHKGEGRSPARFIHRDDSDWFFQLQRTLRLKPQSDSSQY